MKILIVISLTFTTLFALAENIKTFQANFTQTLTDDSERTITYSGKVQIERPNLAKWEYVSPVKKDIYINSRQVTIIEPELEQVIVRKLDKDLDIFKILQSAKKVGTDRYLALYLKREFKIKMVDDKLVSITYQDDFENRINIVFSSQQTNQIIPPERFVPNMPNGFDLLTE